MPTETNQVSHEEWVAAIKREQRQFDKMLPTLLESFDGEYVALYRGEVVGHNSDDSELYGDMLAKLGYVPFLIQRASREPEILEIENVESGR